MLKKTTNIKPCIKKCFPTRRLARKKLKHLKFGMGYIELQRIYKCRNYQRYHLTSQKKRPKYENRSAEHSRMAVGA